MASKFAPGQLCIVISSPLEENVGRTVTCIEYLGKDPVIDRRRIWADNVWEIDVDLKYFDKKQCEYKDIPYADESQLMPIDNYEEKEGVEEDAKQKEGC